MAKPPQGGRNPNQDREKALKIARGTQRPGQTKEQTKLIAQGIQKGMEEYRKQYKARLRELDKKLKKSESQRQGGAQTETATEELIRYRQSPWPWVMLVLSWAGFGLYLALSNHWF